VTPLEQQIAIARRQIVSDGYDMSIGELINLYKNAELIINPSYQRLFRWTDSQKTRFIESLLLGIPIPPIFVFQKADGVWELIDGLQRTSTILEFIGVLRDPAGEPMPPSQLEGTTHLPALAGVRWSTNGDPSNAPGLTIVQQLALKRARIRIEILQKESDEDAKFELFQRLNTGGSILSEQEVRNCVLVMANPSFYDWLTRLADSEAFTHTATLTDTARKQQKHVELVLRYLSYRRIPYKPGLDVNEYLDAAARTLSRMTIDERSDEEAAFRATFTLLSETLGSDTFKKWDGRRHTGPFLISGFDAIAHGVAANLPEIRQLSNPDQWVRDRVRATWEDSIFQQHSGMGVRGTTRLINLLPFGERFFRP